MIDVVDLTKQVINDLNKLSNASENENLLKTRKYQKVL